MTHYHLLEVTMLSDKQPNILILMTDEQNVFMNSVYGHPFVKTPNMQRIADKGVTLDAAYCNSPTCVASRAAFMTGDYPSSVGVYDLSASLSSNQPTWAHVLNNAGYETVLNGKMHFIGPDQLHGFQKRIVEDIHGDGSQEGVPNWDAMPRRGIRNAERRIVNAGKPGHTEEHDYDRKVRDAAVEYIKQYASGEQDKPFALCTSFISPHFPLIVEEKYFNMYYPDLADLPWHPEPIDHPMYHRFRYHFGVDQEFDDEVLKRCRAAYYGLITFVDELIGDVLDALEETGLADNTFIMMTSDHGEMLGERGLWWKSAMLEHSARVPFIVSHPGKLPEGERRRGVASLVDVAPTLAEVAGIEQPETFAGESMLGMLADENAQWKDTARVEYLAHAALHPQATWRRGKYKLIYSHHEASQLYNIEDDPYELRNLADDPAHVPITRAMEKELLEQWDADALEKEVRRSQRMRRVIRQRKRKAKKK